MNGYIVFNNGAGITVGSDNSKVLNNTVSGNKTGISAKNAKSVTIQNNIIYANGEAVAGEGHTLSNNLVNVNPLFVNAEARDFHLKAGSPAIDAGAALKDVAADKDGVARPQGKACDIGAYEFKATK